MKKVYWQIIFIVLVAVIVAAGLTVQDNQRLLQNGRVLGGQSGELKSDKK